MDDVVSYYSSLFADFWKNAPIDLHTPFTSGKICQHGVRNHPLSFHFSLSNGRLQSSM